MDIVKRLRDLRDDLVTYGYVDAPSAMEDAAKEIEKLRAALEWISENGPDDAWELREKAGNALPPKW